MPLRNRSPQHISYSQWERLQLKGLRTIVAYFCVVLNGVLAVISVLTMMIQIIVILALIKITTI